MKFLFRTSAALVLIVAAVLGYMVYRLSQPYQGFSAPVFVDFDRGTSTRKMAEMLAERGVVESPWLFEAARALHRDARLQAGEYKFDRPASPFDVFGRINRGDIYFVELVVPEGYNMFDIAETIGRLGMLTPQSFLAAAKDPSLIRDMDPAAPSLEGYLFPNTYRIYRYTTGTQLARLMTNEFRSQWAALGAGANVHDAITLASMVEREAKRPEERPLVASVFRNRLNIEMRLDCDPTTVYAALLDGRYRGAIHQSDLGNRSRWNTYQHAGLPPGPIANPGLKSIQAALNPASTHYLYFVAKADGSGGHNFSESVVDHAANVAQYRRAVRQ